MVRIEETGNFQNAANGIKDNLFKEKIKKQIKKIITNPEVGKPMKHGRKGTRELYVKPFRLSYAYIKEKDKIILLDLYHKKKQ
ncbi:type II toxin-antitoxin system RelE/ParE family toxin [Candidatus Pacearchaeota archaeon]|nr:type II toxin-antitoxin system RelE/ParE family toxin [Candidatus Pacearchaeota archaeon]